MHHQPDEDFDFDFDFDYAVCPPGFTPVKVMFEIGYIADDGSGLASFSMLTFWPGTPQVGQSFTNMEIPWTASALWHVYSVDIVHNGEGDLEMCVVLDTLDLAAATTKSAELTGTEFHPSKEEFIRAVGDFLDQGFDLFDVRWRDVDAENMESLDHLFVDADLADDDEDFDDEEDE